MRGSSTHCLRAPSCSGNATRFRRACCSSNLFAVAGGRWPSRSGCAGAGAPRGGRCFTACGQAFVAVQRDLTEPLAYGLVTAAPLILDLPVRWRYVAAGVVFGLAGLARQTTLVFPLLYAAWLAWDGEFAGRANAPRRRRLRDAAVLAVLAVARTSRIWCTCGRGSATCRAPATSR